MIGDLGGGDDGAGVQQPTGVAPAGTTGTARGSVQQIGLLVVLVLGFAYYGTNKVLHGDDVAVKPSPAATEYGRMVARRRQLQVAADWYEESHKSVTDLAAAILLESFSGEDLVAQFDKFWGNLEFRAAINDGMEDAGNNIQYTGLFQSNHFYDPDTETNFLGFGETAVDSGSTTLNEYIPQYMARAIDKGSTLNRLMMSGFTPSDEDWYNVGYDLGLALHFLTDLAQPMHAANFANNIGDRVWWFFGFNPFDNRHDGFELLAEKYIDANYLNDPPPEIPNYTDDLSPAGYTLGEVLIETAILSKSIFENVVLLVMPDIFEEWDKDDVLNILNLSLKDIGLKQTAKFFLFFAEQATRDSILPDQAPTPVAATVPAPTLAPEAEPTTPPTVSPTTPPTASPT